MTNPNNASSSSSVETSVGAQERLRDVLGFNSPWPATSVLRRLVDAADHLLKVHDCDDHGWEGVCAARDAARKIADELESLLMSAPLQEPLADDAVDDLARSILCDLAEGDGIHSEELDRNIIIGKVKHFMGWATPPREQSGHVEALREIARLRLATNEGSLRVRADQMWQIAENELLRIQGVSAPLQENMQEQDFARGGTMGNQESVVPHRNDGEK
jgi:hypothetical protein